VTTPDDLTERAGPADLAVLAENPRDFDSRIRALMPDLLAYFLRRVQPREDAADCLSDTLLVLWRRTLDMPGTEDAARAWSFGIARNVLANQRRGRLRHRQLSDALRAELAVFAPPPESITGTLRDALQELGDKDRDLLTFVIWEGLGIAEAGAILGLKPAAARARYARARKRMRELLS